MWVRSLPHALLTIKKYSKENQYIYIFLEVKTLQESQEFKDLINSKKSLIFKLYEENFRNSKDPSPYIRIEYVLEVHLNAYLVRKWRTLFVFIDYVWSKKKINFSSKEFKRKRYSQRWKKEYKRDEDNHFKKKFFTYMKSEVNLVHDLFLLRRYLSYGRQQPFSNDNTEEYNT